MSTLADQIRNGNQNQRGTPCTAGLLIDRHEQAEQLRYLVSITDKGHEEYLEGSAIAAFISTETTQVNGGTVNRHRRGVTGGDGCKCRYE